MSVGGGEIPLPPFKYPQVALQVWLPPIVCRAENPSNSPISDGQAPKYFLFEAVCTFVTKGEESCWGKGCAATVNFPPFFSAEKCPPFH